jgi:hypothetical protein
MYLTLLNCTFKMVKMVNFILCTFYHIYFKSLSYKLSPCKDLAISETSMIRLVMEILKDIADFDNLELIPRWLQTSGVAWLCV